ncbi:hypothetical protein C8R46DRAFT_1246234 [Mycena filopes]|nr:hypothetical protein C8R46DRAFT_1246234 [Mycena filopes]
MLLSTILCLTTSTSALAHAAAVRDGPTGIIISHTLPCKFTLAAHNVTLPNANSTGVPLVLAPLPGTIADGASYEITSTYSNSYPNGNPYPTLSLTNSSLRAYRASGAWLTNATAPPTTPGGGPLLWYTSVLFDREAAGVFEAHTGAASTTPNSTFKDAGGKSLPRLAAYGAAHLWSLCPTPGPQTQTSEVFFNVSRERDECWKVTLHLVPLADADDEGC